MSKASKTNKATQAKRKKNSSTVSQTSKSAIARDSTRGLIVDKVAQKKKDAGYSAGFSRGWQLIKPSIAIYRRNLEMCLIFFVIPSLILSLSTILSGNASVITTKVAVGYLLFVLGGLWLLINTATAYVFQLKAARGDNPGIIDTYREGLPYVPRLLGLLLLAGLLFVGGLVFFIIPGIIFIRRYYLAPYYIVDQDLGIREAMQRSAAESKPCSYAVYSVVIISLLFGAISAGLGRISPPFGSAVGLVIGTLYVFAPAILFLDIQRANGAEPPAPIEE